MDFTRQWPINSNRGALFSVESAPRCYQQEKFSLIYIYIRIHSLNSNSAQSNLTLFPRLLFKMDQYEGALFMNFLLKQL